MSIDVEAVYQALCGAFARHKHMMLHPQYPEDLMQRRLPLLRKVPFYFADHYVMNLVADERGIWPQHLLRIGERSAEHAIRLFARAYAAARDFGLPICGESYSFAWVDERTILGSEVLAATFQQQLKMRWQGVFFAALNPNANELVEPVAGDLTDPFADLEPPAGVEAQRDVFHASVHVGRLDPAVVDYVRKLLVASSMVFVSADSEADLNHLRREARGRLGFYATETAPCMEWALELDTMRRLSQIDGVLPETRVLLEGTLYEDGTPC